MVGSLEIDPGNLFLVIFITIMLVIIATLIYFSTRISTASKYTVNRKLNNIDRKKLFLIWLKIQVVIGFCSIGNKQMDWLLILGLPIILIIFILLTGISSPEKDIYESEDYKEFLKENEERRKVEERDKKIKKILR